MQFEVWTSAGLPDDLRDAWTRLADGDPLRSWQWRSAWWKQFGDELRLSTAVARHEGRVVGIAPCYSSDDRWLGQTLGWLADGKTCTDYQRFLIDESLPAEQAAEVTIGLTHALIDGTELGRRQNLWILDGIRPDDPQQSLVQTELERHGFQLHAEPLESCWSIDLPGDWDAFVGQLSSRMRRDVRRACRDLELPHVAIHSATGRSEIEAIWSEFVRLHGLRFRDRAIDGGCFGDAAFESFLRSAVGDLAEAGMARIVWCELSGAAVAAHLYLLGRDTWYLYQTGFDPANAKLAPSRLLLSFVAREIAQRGGGRLDFLRGDEHYKSDWNCRQTTLVRLFAVSPRRIARWRHQTYQWARNLRRLARSSWSHQAGPSRPPAFPVDPAGTEPVVRHDAPHA